MNTILEEIRSRGYWRVIIRPYKFEERRIPELKSLYPILQKTVVSARGWDFPHLGPQGDFLRDVDSIGQYTDWQHNREHWRFYQSGQFYYIFGMPEDWRDKSSIWPPHQNWEPLALLGVGETIYKLTEILEFSARLALTDAGDESMHINIQICNLEDRVLYIEDPRRWGFDRIYKTNVKEYPITKVLSRTELIASHNDLALRAAGDLFQRFGWDTNVENLRDWQEKLLKRIA